MNNVIRLADKSDNAAHWQVADALKDALAKVESGEIKARKILIAFALEDGGYRYLQAQLNDLEQIGMCYRIANLMNK